MSFCCSLFQDSDLIVTIKGPIFLPASPHVNISELHLFGYNRKLQLTVSFCHRLCNPIIHRMTQANLSIFLYLLPFITSYTQKKPRLTTVQSFDQHVHDTHTEHNYSFLTSHLSPSLKRFLRESDSCYLWPAMSLSHK